MGGGFDGNRGVKETIIATLVQGGRLWASQAVKNFSANAGDFGSTPGSRKIHWRRAWQPTPVFLPGEICGQRSLAGYSP